MLSGLTYLVLPFPVSRATGSCTRTFPFPFHVFSYLYECGLSTRRRLLVCLPFPLLSRRLVSLCSPLTHVSFCHVDSSGYVSCLCFTPFSLSTRLLTLLVLDSDSFTTHFPFTNVCTCISQTSIYMGWRWDCSPSSIYFATTLKV